MSEFTIHTKDTAPAGSVQTLQAVEKKFGFVPNMMAVLAEAPAAANAYLGLIGGLERDGTLSSAERQFLMIAISAHNGCEYCVPAHSAGAGGAGLAHDAIAAAASGDVVDNPRLSALRGLAHALIEKHGRITPQDVNAFLGAGFGNAELLEVIVCLAAKTISNYTNHIAKIPLDEQFKK